MDPDAALKAVALRVDRAGSVAEERTRESLEYSTIDVTDARRLIVEFQTALVSAYQTLQVLGSAIAIMAGKTKFV